MATDHAGGGRRRRRHRGDLQHAHRRRDVRHRADDARGQFAHLPAGGPGDRYSHLYRSAVPGPQARLRSAVGLFPVEPALAALRDPALHIARCDHWIGGDRIRARVAVHRAPVRPPAEPVYAPRHRHDGCRRNDVRAVPLFRSLPYRRRWLLDDSGHPHGRARSRAVPDRPVRGQACGDTVQPRFRLFGRHLFALAIHRRDTGCGVRRRFSIGGVHPGAATSSSRHLPLRLPPSP